MNNIRKIAYADPPYLGCSRYYDHPDAGVWDNPRTHIDLMEVMDNEYDAWALSLSSTSLRQLLPESPPDTRVAAWVKPFASFKPGIDPAYAWEPVLFKTSRAWAKTQHTCRDFVSSRIAFQKGVIGAKPDAFSFWLFELLGLRPVDEFIDLFVGSGSVTQAWHTYRDQAELELVWED